MATSTCIKCESTRFELKPVEPTGARYKYYFIQCASCGGVVGSHEYFNLGSMLEKIGKALGVKVT